MRALWTATDAPGGDPTLTGATLRVGQRAWRHAASCGGVKDFARTAKPAVAPRRTMEAAPLRCATLRQAVSSPFGPTAVGQSAAGVRSLAPAARSSITGSVAPGSARTGRSNGMVGSCQRAEPVGASASLGGGR
jgi:hypothetical protein